MTWQAITHASGHGAFLPWSWHGISAQHSLCGIEAADGMAGAANSRRTLRSISPRANQFGPVAFRVMPTFLDYRRLEESGLVT